MNEFIIADIHAKVLHEIRLRGIKRDAHGTAPFRHVQFFPFAALDFTVNHARVGIGIRIFIIGKRRGDLLNSNVFYVGYLDIVAQPMHNFDKQAAAIIGPRCFSAALVFSVK